MKKSVLVALLVAGIAMAFTPKASAADTKTVTGEGKCGKCALKETKECQNTVTVKEGDKSVVYYLVHNDVSKEFHENICKGTKKVKAVGTVKEVDGKKQLTATKIELVKD
jgi:RecG-like helicase